MATTNIHYIKNRLFAKYGHECEIEDTEDNSSIQDSKTFLDKMKSFFLRIRIVSEVNQMSNYYLRSQGAIKREKERQINLHPYMIHPFSDIRKWWECLMIITLILEFTMIPLDIGYFMVENANHIATSFGWVFCRFILDLLLITDVLLNFWTGYFNEYTKSVVLKPRKITRNYLRSTFGLDLISSLPTHVDLFFTIDICSYTYYGLQFVSFLKIWRVRTFTVYWNRITTNYNVDYVLKSTIYLGIYIFLNIHFVGCLMMFYTAHQKKIGLAAVEENALPLSAYERYVYNIYRAVIIVLTAGYGDKLPNHSMAYLSCIICWFLSKVLYIAALARVMEIIKATTSARHKYVEMVRQLREYMSHKQLPDYMQKRLLTYYEFRFQKSYFRESEILATISGQLKQEIVMHSCRKLVENVAFFKNLPLTLLVRIVSCLRSEVYLVNDVIVRANTPGDAMFFIATGTVAVMTTSGSEICHLEDGSHFGEVALVMHDELRVASVVAVEVCELYRLERKDFVRAIYPYPDLLDNIQRIAVERMEMTSMLDEHNRRQLASRRLY